MRAFFRSVFFLPSACSFVVAALVWKMSIFNGVHYGLVNTVLELVRRRVRRLARRPHPPWYWLVHRHRPAVAPVGFYMILFLAALQQIPRELYEAAAVDGAKPGWQTFRYITLPQLRATSVAVLLLLLIAAYQAFDEFFNLSATTPAGRPPLVYLYYTALGNQDYGARHRGRPHPGALICDRHPRSRASSSASEGGRTVTITGDRRPGPQAGRSASAGRRPSGSTGLLRRPRRRRRAVPAPLLPDPPQRPVHRRRHHRARAGCCSPPTSSGRTSTSCSTTRR